MRVYKFLNCDSVLLFSNDQFSNDQSLKKRLLKTVALLYSSLLNNLLTISS